MNEMDTWVDVLRGNALRIPAQRAFTFLHNGEEELESVTFGELDRRARAVAAALVRVATPGERALLLYPQGVDYVVAFFACLYAGVIAVPLYSPQNRRKIAMIGKVARDCGARWALSTRPVIDKYRDSWSHAEAIPAMEWLATDELAGGAADDWQRPAIGGETVAYLQYTSGSTSDPKGVVLSHRPVLAQAREIVEAWGTTEGSVMVSWLPHYHDFGQVFGILQPVFQGFHCVLMSPAAFVYPQDIEATVEESHPLLRPGFSAAFSVDDGAGEQLVVVVERKRYFDDSVGYPQVLERVREEIAVLHGIDVAEILVIKTGTIPKTSSGKIQRAACRDLYLRGELPAIATWRAPAPAPAPSPARKGEGSMSELIRVSIGERVLGSVARVKQIDSREVEMARSLAHYGVSSLDMLELHTDIGDWLGYEIPDEWIWDSKSIGELVDHITNSYDRAAAH
ncbi:non-ribosomal peptide synthetase [Endothiovibrio diazotrophicus]